MIKKRNLFYFTVLSFVLLIVTQIVSPLHVNAEPVIERESDTPIEESDSQNQRIDSTQETSVTDLHKVNQESTEEETPNLDQAESEEVAEKKEAAEEKEADVDQTESEEAAEEKEADVDQTESEEAAEEEEADVDQTESEEAAKEEEADVDQTESEEAAKEEEADVDQTESEEAAEEEEADVDQTESEEETPNSGQAESKEAKSNEDEKQASLQTFTTAHASANTSGQYFKVMTDNLTVYDNRGEGPLKPVGKLKKDQVFPIVRSYTNWWAVQFGDFYGYVRKAETQLVNNADVNNWNTIYENTEHKYKAHQDVMVYDNTSGSLVPFGVLDKGTVFPVVREYTNWWGIVYLDRVGYIRKREGEIQYATFGDYFKADKDLAIYDNRGNGPLKKVGEVNKDQTYKRVSDYGNWHRIQFGDIYGYVKKFYTSTSDGKSIKNENKNYTHSKRNMKALEKVTVYDNTSGNLVPFGSIEKGTIVPIATDYTNWWRVILADRVGYVRKSSMQAEFQEGDKYFRVHKDGLEVYDNRTDGPLEKVGSLKKDQAFKILRGYTNWWRVQFGDFYGYVRKSDTGYATGSEIKNSNKDYTNSTEKYIANQDVTVYDNSSGKLVPLGQLDKGTVFPIATDYTNWWGIVYLDRIGYVRKNEGRVLYTNFDKYFRAEANLAVYDNREDGPLKKVGELKKGQFYPRVSDYGNWHRIQFGDYYGYVTKDFTTPVINAPIQNENKNDRDHFRHLKALQDVTVYDNTSGSLIPFGIIDKDANFSIIGDYGKWWEVLFADRVGYLRKTDVQVEISEDDQFFRAFTENTPVYDNSRGYLVKIGELEKNQVFSVLSSHGNWWGIQFGDTIGYVRKRDTGFATINEIGNLNEQYTHSKQKFIVKSNAPVYDNSSGSLKAMGVLDKGTVFPIATDYGNWWRIIFTDRVGYVNKKHVLEYKEHNIENIIKEYKDRDTSAIMNRINRFSPAASSNYIASADNMLKGKYRISSYGTYDFSNGIKWGESPIEGKEMSRSYYRALHGHFFVNDLIAAYKDKGDKAYIDKGFEVIQDWIDQNPYGNTTNPLAWHDEGTSRRLITWIQFYNVAKEVLSLEQQEFLLDNMIEHADLLTTDAFHTTNTNHGMFQDEALIVFSDYFNQLSKSQLYNEVGKERLKAYFDFIISPEGVHLEHSPAYHQIIANSVKKYRDYFEQKQDQEELSYYDKIYNAMADYYIWVIKPDGNLPLIGDTFSEVAPPKYLWRDNPFYQYVLTGGKAGKKPPTNSIVFEEADYAIFRGDWEDGKDATYLHFTAAYHTDYHKHSDDLSVWIYANGHDIITESGPNGYDYDLPFTEYAYSSFAHNTLIVNDKGLPRVDGQYDKVYIKDHSLTERVSKATGINKRYQGVEHERDVMYDHNKDQITITDTIISDDENNYKLLWNLADGVTPEIHDNHIKLFIDGEEVMSIDINSTDKINISVKKGQTNPNYIGWHLKDRNEPVETYTIIVEANEASTEIETVFSVK